MRWCRALIQASILLSPPLARLLVTVVSINDKCFVVMPNETSHGLNSVDGAIMDASPPDLGSNYPLSTQGSRAASSSRAIEYSAAAAIVVLAIIINPIAICLL